MNCTAFSWKAQSKIGEAFARYGRALARHPWKFIIICVLVNSLLGIGMVRLTSETDTATVYTPMNSRAQQDSKQLRTLFPDMSGTSFFPIQRSEEGIEADVIVRTSSGNVMEKTVLEEVKELYNYIASLKTEYNGENISLSNICARDVRGCVIAGDFFFSPEFIMAVTNGNVTYPVFHHPKTGAIFYQNRVGDVRVNGPILTSARMLSLRFYFRTDGEKYKAMFKTWKKKFVSNIKLFFSEHIQIAFSHTDSLGDELSSTITGDITLFSITFALMITYACVATLTARWDCVGQRSHLGYPGVIAAAMSIASSFGLVSACGVKFVSIVGIMPFLIIGIGVDDMFILLSGLSDAQEKETVEEKIAETMRKSGVAITITSLTDLLAFIAGTTSVFLGVRNFCIYTGTAVLLCYLNQTTFFAACLALHEKRVAARRHFFTCIKVMSKEESKDAKTSQGNILCCTGSPPRSRKDVDSFLDKLPTWLLPKIVLNLPMKIIILSSFTVYLVASIYGITILKQGLELKHLVSESSYYYKFRDWSDNHFQTVTPVSFVISNTISYSDVGNQNRIRSLLDNVKKDTEIQNSTEINWLSTYQQSAFYDNSSEVSFVSNLIYFLKSPFFKRFENDVAFDNTNKTISSSRFYVFSVDQKSTIAQGNLMLRMRKYASQSSLPLFAFSPSFIYFEQYVEILPQTIQTVGMAIVAVFFVTVLFMPHPVLLIFLTITVAMIMVGIFGFLDYFGLTLSSITMVHIVMSVGFSVDFAAHICHGYMISSGDTRNERVRSTLVRSGAPIFHGAASSLLGIIILLQTSTYIFMSFFKIMLLVIIFGITHALLFLPVIFSFIGPHQKSSSSIHVTDVKKDKEMTFQQPLDDILQSERFHEALNCVYYQDNSTYNTNLNNVDYDEQIKQNHGNRKPILEHETIENRYKRNWE